MLRIAKPLRRGEVLGIAEDKRNLGMLGDLVHPLLGQLRIHRHIDHTCLERPQESRNHLLMPLKQQPHLRRL